MTRWVLIYMARFQEIQEKIQRKLTEFQERFCQAFNTEMSKDNESLLFSYSLVYLDAAINEVQRHCSMVSMGVFRYTTNDVQLEGYDIPKLFLFAGKRQCLGEQFARMELFLIIASLLQNFTFSAPEGEGPMSLDPQNIPNGHLPNKDQKFVIKCRN
ncbi:hypothetical protein Avbf_08364 [Armadillidium vulgare]|nr:hypothetical protein Avbf_08364 [Armadillidium vulgare]